MGITSPSEAFLTKKIVLQHLASIFQSFSLIVRIHLSRLFLIFSGEPGTMSLVGSSIDLYCFSIYVLGFVY